MIFTRLYGIRSMLAERITQGGTALREQLSTQKASGPEDTVPRPVIGADNIKSGAFYRLRGGAKAYVIGQTHPTTGRLQWVGYIVDEKHNIYHEFNDWWPSGANAGSGPMRAFDIVAPWVDPDVCMTCGKVVDRGGAR